MRMFVPLTVAELERLRRLARAERRRPQDQAAHLLGQVLANTPMPDDRTEPGELRRLPAAS
jgi:hypothetical protein